MKRPTIAAAILLASTACTPAAAPANGVPEAVEIATHRGSRIAKFCDAGRAIYSSWSINNGSPAIAVVDQAPECAR